MNGMTAQLGLNLTIAPELCQGSETPQTRALICFFYRGINRKEWKKSSKSAPFLTIPFQKVLLKPKTIGESYRYMNIFNVENRKFL